MKTWEGVPWHGVSAGLKELFGRKTVRLSLNGGFTCPNRDGTLGNDGCLFCDGDGAGTFGGTVGIEIREQLETQKALLGGKWKDPAYIAYFQSFTNTYGPVERLKGLYGEALSDPQVVGLAIATRPDCLGDEVISLLRELNRSTFLWVELGVQTFNEATGARIGRGCGNDALLSAMDRLRAAGIRTVLHLINGLPGESREDMLSNVVQAAALKPWGVKLHLLHVLKGTGLERMYLAGEYLPMTQEAYIRTVADQLELLPESILIHRLTGDAPRQSLVAPLWSRDKKAVLNGISRELRSRGSWQGKRCEES